MAMRQFTISHSPPQPSQRLVLPRAASIVGFGGYHYKYASGYEGDAALAGVWAYPLYLDGDVTRMTNSRQCLGSPASR